MEHAALLFLFALGTQCALAWIFALLFLAFLRTAGEPPYLRSWTWAWFARALGLSAILVRFTLLLARGESQILSGTFQSAVLYSLYQGAKVLTIWWLLEGVLAFAERAVSPKTRRWIPWFLLLAALASVQLSDNVEDLLLVQCPLVIGASLVAALVLFRLVPERRSAGTRLTGAALLAQATLWVLYSITFLDRNRGPWPLERTPWTLLAAHNSYFDLAVDVMVASGLVVLLLQDVHRRQLEAESERSRMQAELARSERLRSLGTLVSGVAHELNNPLTAILGFAEALVGPESESERARYANIIREQALRCRRIVRGLATFSGKESEVFEHIAFHALLVRVTRGFEFELGRRNVRVEIQAPDSLPELVGDRFALEQLAANLLANAAQASPAGGSVTLALRFDQGALELRVEDEGPGIPSDVLAHIFDPFFTTRVPGEGMGLGLAVVHGIVRAHDGTIRAENRDPRGARLVVTLPVRSRRRSSEALGDDLVTHEIPPYPRRVASGTEAPLELLVIEDEVLLCEMLASFGARRGWRVALATSGSVGLARLRAEGQRFDVVLCDLRMATPSGIEIHDRLAVEDPQLLRRFLFITGDLGSEEVAEFARRASRPILRKPFRNEELALRVEELAVARDVAGRATP